MVALEMRGEKKVENLFKYGAAASTAIVSFLWGEWSLLLTVLLVLVFLDYGSGLAAAWTEGKNHPKDKAKGLSSRIGMRGIVKKVFIFVVIAMGNLVDYTLIETGMRTEPIVFQAAVVFYIFNECISLLENVGRMGIPVPNQLKQAVQVLKDKGEDKDEKIS
ncbi:phage holin family protein [Alkalihalobacillus sp. LMS39]|uniref:phage holin family protein n=1 Tax=Alkalihalobacillus sp. LMS39 TaxID=2924032 RepID=UPI001FB3A6FB|nr:phage holin family protein [Alkalihalobacillus sp. LMS39]UOE96083.1 phage holin family protein [Alkalihalobacillus sp. LMS39]